MAGLWRPDLDAAHAAHPPSSTCEQPLNPAHPARRRRNMLQQRHRSWPTLAGDPRELLQEAGVLSSGTAW